MRLTNLSPLNPTCETTKELPELTPTEWELLSTLFRYPHFSVSDALHHYALRREIRKQKETVASLESQYESEKMMISDEFPPPQKLGYERKLLEGMKKTKQRLENASSQSHGDKRLGDYASADSKYYSSLSEKGIIKKRRKTKRSRKRETWILAIDPLDYCFDRFEQQGSFYPEKLRELVRSYFNFPENRERVLLEDIPLDRQIERIINDARFAGSSLLAIRKPLGSFLIRDPQANLSDAYIESISQQLEQSFEIRLDKTSLRDVLFALLLQPPWSLVFSDIAEQYTSILFDVEKRKKFDAANRSYIAAVTLDSRIASKALMELAQLPVIRKNEKQHSDELQRQHEERVRQQDKEIAALRMENSMLKKQKVKRKKII